jgi:hypothetical protein
VLLSPSYFLSCLARPGLQVVLGSPARREILGVSPHSRLPALQQQWRVSRGLTFTPASFWLSSCWSRTLDQESSQRTDGISAQSCPGC